MKKIAYIVGGILIGFVFSTAGGVFADTVKSMVGKKVTGEYSIIVNGKSLSDKGAVIEGKANIPVRGISEALGANVKVEGKIITITTEGDSPEANPAKSSEDNKYSGRSKDDLQEILNVLNNHILAPNIAGREEISKELERLKKAGADEVIIKERESQLAGYDERIASTKADITLAEEALAALK